MGEVSHWNSGSIDAILSLSPQSPSPHTRCGHRRYRSRFKQLDPAACADLTDVELAEALTDPGIVRHRQKVPSVRQNARVFLAIQAEFGSFDAYVWSFVGGTPVVNTRTTSDLPTTTDAGKTLSTDLKRRGMTFVGPTIAYAYMQAAGLVSDHLASCWRSNAT
eukprot:m.218741 g.218741  ORF g.218741 m.218741 type:complete len:163 (+) comp25722_c0_seq2:499-987(+)